MDLLFVTQVRRDAPHGGARHVDAVARELAGLGHRVRLLALGAGDPLPGVELLSVDPDLRAGVRAELLLAQRTGEEVRRRRPDVAYVRISASTSAVPLTLAALRVPLVLELNGDILDELRSRGRPELAVRTVQASLAAAARAARVVVAASAKTGRHAERALHAPRVVVIENGADLPRATPGARDEARRELSLELDRQYVGFAATLGPELRTDLLLAAQEELRTVGLLVAGDGPRRAELEARARQAPAERPIRVLGPVPHTRALTALRACDVCVNVRDQDLGMKCLEFAALGRRFVTFELEGTERYLPLYPGLEAVHLVRERTPRALAGAIAKALEAERRLGPLPAEAVERARRTLGWDHTARRIAEVLERCL